LILEDKDPILEQGLPVEIGGNKTFFLNDADDIWIVRRGQAELFALPVERGGAAGRRSHLITVTPGQALFGLGTGFAEIRLLVSGTPGTEVVRLTRSEFLQAAGNRETAANLLKEWLGSLLEAIVLEQGGEDSRLQAAATAEWLEHDREWSSLPGFYQALFAHLAAGSDRARLEEINYLQKKEANKKKVMGQSLLSLAAVAQTGKEDLAVDVTDDLLYEACRLVGRAANIEITKPAAEVRANLSSNPLEDIINASYIRMRRVALKGEWWCQDNGPLLAYLAESERPVALLPQKSKSYLLCDPDGTKIPVNRELAEKIMPFAYSFYRTLPARKIEVKDIIKFSWQGKTRRDTLTMILMGIVASLLGLAVPLATGRLIDTVIPEAERGQLVELTFILLVSMVAVTLFQLTRAVAQLRMEGRLDLDLQAAVWDRLLSLPAPFFRSYSVGDLAMRANSINAIRKILSGVTITTVLSGVFSSFNFFLLFYYSTSLALIALVLVIISVSVTVSFSFYQLRMQRELTAKQRDAAGLILQLIRGIAKFRVAGAEVRAFHLWSKAFSAVRRITFKTRDTANYVQIFNTVFPVSSTLIVFAFVGLMPRSSMSTGQFLAFYSAFAAFIAAMLATSSAIVSTLGVIPLYESAKPILETLPEIESNKRHPGELTGKIEVSRVSFRYSEDTPLILDDISLTIKPGEFAAIVGSSGSGKSTLFRLLMGFEKPQSGAVYYDGQDISQLDVRAVRRQFGVVLQNSKLMTGDIFTNIVGTKKLSVNDALEAARMAGMEEDIKQMPMGIHTVVSEGGSTLSGGQRQRLLIARAIASRPRILFFDEATSALDNRTQSIVSRSLEQLRATRIVVAHRLSTIIKADRIYVLDQGRVVQVGTYDELMKQEGLFAELAKRQLA
jgi:ATP-binding cassette subfamily C protein